MHLFQIMSEEFDEKAFYTHVLLRKAFLGDGQKRYVCSRWREKSVHFITRRHSWCEITTLLRNYSVDQ